MKKTAHYSPNSPSLFELPQSSSETGPIRVVAVKGHVRRIRGSGVEWDAQKSLAARDEGIERVSQKALNQAWIAGVLSFIRYDIPIGWVGASEDVRGYYRERNGCDPVHPNLWGAVIRGAVRTGLLIRTGNHRLATIVSSHARETPEYRRVDSVRQNHE